MVSHIFSQQKKFSPLVFLASLGAGGIAIMPFVFFQYTFYQGKGLVTFAQMNYHQISFFQAVFFHSLEGIMVLFSLIHFVLTVIFLRRFFTWKKTSDFKDFVQNPLKNAGLLAPFISLIMTMNILIGPIRYFIPSVHNNFQELMLPALLIWLVLYVLLIKTDLYLLKISFSKGFDVGKISFGWLLHPFALGMITVVGTGIAAMAQQSSIAHTAAFFSMISGVMGLFLLLVKLVVIFKSHFMAKGLPERQFMPSFLIVIPNITLFAIATFRFGHYLHVHQAVAVGSGFNFVVIGLAFAFQIWYLLFGLTLMKDYFKKHYFEKEFYTTQWGLICPVVAFGVLGAFAFKMVFSFLWLYVLIPVVVVLAVVFYFDLLHRHIRCSRRKKTILRCN